jgi:hypothetical protein
LIKGIRFGKGKELFNVTELMKSVKDYHKRHLIDLAENNEKLANDPTVDNNNMMMVMITSLALNTVRLILMVFNFAYFIGMGWLILCHTIDRIQHDDPM